MNGMVVPTFHESHTQAIHLVRFFFYSLMGNLHVNVAQASEHGRKHIRNWAFAYTHATIG